MSLKENEESLFKTNFCIASFCTCANVKRYLSRGPPAKPYSHAKLRKCNVRNLLHVLENILNP